MCFCISAKAMKAMIQEELDKQDQRSLNTQQTNENFLQSKIDDLTMQNINLHEVIINTKEQERKTQLQVKSLKNKIDIIINDQKYNKAANKINKFFRSFLKIKNNSVLKFNALKEDLDLVNCNISYKSQELATLKSNYTRCFRKHEELDQTLQGLYKLSSSEKKLIKTITKDKQQKLDELLDLRGSLMLCENKLKELKNDQEGILAQLEQYTVSANQNISSMELCPYRLSNHRINSQGRISSSSEDSISSNDLSPQGARNSTSSSDFEISTNYNPPPERIKPLDEGYEIKEPDIESKIEKEEPIVSEDKIKNLQQGYRADFSKDNQKKESLRRYFSLKRPRSESAAKKNLFTLHREVKVIDMLRILSSVGLTANDPVSSHMEVGRKKLENSIKIASNKLIKSRSEERAFLLQLQKLVQRECGNYTLKERSTDYYSEVERANGIESPNKGVITDEEKNRIFSRLESYSERTPTHLNNIKKIYQLVGDGAFTSKNDYERLESSSIVFSERINSFIKEKKVDARVIAANALVEEVFNSIS